MFRDERETNCCDEIFETFLALFWIRFDPPEKALEDAFFASHDDVVHLKVLLHLGQVQLEELFGPADQLEPFQQKVVRSRLNLPT